MPVVLLMVLEHEVIELVPLYAPGLDLPEEERSDWVVAHKAVEKPLDPGVSAIRILAESRGGRIPWSGSDRLLDGS